MDFDILFIILCICLASAWADGTKENIYKDMSGVNVCIRRLNATHQIGCNSGRKGNVGVLHYVTSAADLDWLMDDGPYEPYVLMMDVSYFTLANIEMVKKKISGVLLIRPNDTDVPDAYSSDTTCPNENFDVHKDDPSYGHCRVKEWNPPGTGMFFHDYEFPMAILSNHSEVDFLINDCYVKFNQPVNGKAQDYPQCAVQISSAMDGAVDTPTCIRRSNKVTNINPQGYCDPLAGNNVYSFVSDIGSNVSNNSVIAAMTRLDTLTLFEGVYPATDAAVTGIITLLATAQLLSQHKDSLRDAAPIAFLFFNGEAFDYSGSSRFIYDLEKNDFLHLDLPKFREVFEVLQVGMLNEGSLWIHADPLVDEVAKAKINELATYFMTTAAKDLPVGRVDDTFNTPLPPASTQSFIKKSPSLPHLVITDHKAEFSNKHYHSVYDNRTNIGLPDNLTYGTETELSQQLTKLASALATLLYYEATGAEPPLALEANSTLVAQLVYCYIYDPKCQLFRETINADDDEDFEKLTIGSMTFYVSPLDGENTVARFTRQVLAYFQGAPDVPNECGDTASKKCCEKADDKANEKNGIRYFWMYGSDNEGYCIRTTASSASAVSPAFVKDGYDLSSDEYPAWTESRWAVGAIFIRAFLVPPRWLELVTLFTGLAIVLISFPCCFFVKKRAHILFAQSQ